MVKKLLCALEYPEQDSLDLKDESTFRKIIVWAESNKIKKAAPDVSRTLININASEWRPCFNKYIQFLGAPDNIKSNEEYLQWLLGYAVQIEIDKNKDLYKKHIGDTKNINVPSVVAENPLDKLNFSSKEFLEGISAIAKILKITSHPDPQITLKAVKNVVTTRLTPHALDNPQQYIIRGTPFPLQDADLGFESNDPVLKQAAKILRMLYIQDLRDLQTKANELIVAVQNVTANPKTDTRLGKVGR